jgi:hypothetical protein
VVVSVKLWKRSAVSIRRDSYPASGVIESRRSGDGSRPSCCIRPMSSRLAR